MADKTQRIHIPPEVRKYVFDRNNYQSQSYKIIVPYDFVVCRDTCESC
ncbi:hypothetical protein [Pseudanabaena sp. ABRG5-3]|nr:hypothetical protein [Pseudanabaena sp. ABRG5-3]